MYRTTSSQLQFSTELDEALQTPEVAYQMIWWSLFFPLSSVLPLYSLPLLISSSSVSLFLFQSWEWKEKVCCNRATEAYWWMPNLDVPTPHCFLRWPEVGHMFVIMDWPYYSKWMGILKKKLKCSVKNLSSLSKIRHLTKHPLGTRYLI